MARDFDGTNDKLDFGSDASIDDFVTKSVSLWLTVDSLASERLIVAKDRGAAEWGVTVPTTGVVRFNQLFSTTGGSWEAPAASVAAGALVHVAVTYDRSLTTDDPVFYIDGASVTVTEVQTPVGTSSADATRSLQAGETGTGTLDLDGRIGHLAYHDAILDAAAINRARWWGRPHGGMKVYHPLWTAELVNKGSATANGTATGTTVINSSLPRVERCHGSMMGVGR